VTPAPLIELEHVGHDFDDGRIVALSDVNLTVGTSESIAIVGASGSGKTTLILLMCGIREPSRGTVKWKGAPVTAPGRWTDLRRSEIGIVFQDFNLFPTLTAGENVEVAMFGSGLGARERKRRAEEALASVGLAQRATHLPHALSGGERQRVAIARSIINDPVLLLADEPTGNLDSVNAVQIMDLLFDLQRARGATLVMVSHAPDFARRCARQIRIKDGKVWEEREAPAREEAM
jgi:predicted ABC-type transport system involved in lysophospholipase L1 biosynthesis ATPase subunit